MKDKDEQTALIGMAIGAAVISLVATQKQINQGSIVDELVRLGRQKGDGVEDEVFVQAARLVKRHLANRYPAWQPVYPFIGFIPRSRPASGAYSFPESVTAGAFLPAFSAHGRRRAPRWHGLSDAVTFARLQG
jgi:hypothetical protein